VRLRTVSESYHNFTDMRTRDQHIDTKSFCKQGGRYADRAFLSQ
jgi:hypothetical protein